MIQELPGISRAHNNCRMPMIDPTPHTHGKFFAARYQRNQNANILSLLSITSTHNEGSVFNDSNSILTPMVSFRLLFYWWISLDCEFVMAGELAIRVSFIRIQRVMSPSRHKSGLHTYGFIDRQRSNEKAQAT